METMLRMGLRQHYRCWVASLTGSGINGNWIVDKFNELKQTKVVASLTGSGINGNANSDCSSTGFWVASLTGSGINGN